VIRHGQLLLGDQLDVGAAHSNNLLLDILPLPFGMDESERLGALEQICIAAMDTQNYPLAQIAIARIAKVAGSSVRCKRLEGLLLEAHSDAEGALILYNDMIKENPSNYYAMKRKYCVLKATMRDVEARDILNQYLEKNGSDLGGWMEMAATCMDVGDYSGAAFCYEELILSNPLDSDLHCSLAECYITAGGKDNLKLARKHMAQSLELDPHNLRAMYGLISAAESYLEIQTQSRSKSSAESRDVDEEDLEVARELIRYGVDEILKSYKGDGPISSLVKRVTQSILDLI
jgi:tetratricopeptide (TPR) repeat protein